MTTTEALFATALIAYNGNCMNIGVMLTLMYAISIAVTTEGSPQTGWLLADIVEAVVNNS